MNKPTEISRSRTWLIISGLLMGIVILAWLGVEESSVLGVLLISGLVCAWAGIWLLRRTGSSGKHMILRHVMIGGGAGLCLVPLAIFLMAFKSGIHGHGTPDFTVEQMQSVLSRIPYFIFGGVLLGAGSGMLKVAKKDEIQEGY